MIILIYQQERTLYELDEEGCWTDRRGTVTNTLFVAGTNQDRSPTEAGGRLTIEHAEEPAYFIEVPDGSEFFAKGTATYLRTPDGNAFDAISATIAAKVKHKGFSIHRPNAPARPSWSEVEAAAKPVNPEPVLEPALPGPIVQRSLFD